MPSRIRPAVLERACAELESLPPDPDLVDHEAQVRRERLELLVDHLTEGILSPVVLEAVAASRRSADQR